MKQKIILFLLLFVEITCVYSYGNIVKKGEHNAFSVTLSVQSLRNKGYPLVEGPADLPASFQNPPKGYGNVPFYWWNGDTLKKERLLEQLEILSSASTDGLSVSYIHSHPEVDTLLNAKGYGSFGRADAGAPEVFSDEWWSLWNWFSGKCAEKGVGLGLDDYVLGWADNGYYVDELRADRGFSSYQGRLKTAVYSVSPKEVLNVAVPLHAVTIMAYPAKIDLTQVVKDGNLVWKSTSEEQQKVYVIYTEPSYELHPEYGKRLVDVYFNRFENRLNEQGKRGLNYFFQDELHYDLNIHSWCEDMVAEFQKRKGYDIRTYLPALFDNIGAITPKIRLDYAEVVTQLAEERYFKPVFDWHEKRGLIYGCDNNGRGLEPLQYLDYFRSISWFTAPGNDAPARGSSFRQTKVSSSVAHLYQRPRTWLEAFHSMGWDSNGEWLTSQLDHHVIAGGNLLCLHGLYYSTHGGWWEWAPPCFHFRMPYWPHMKYWLKYAERLTYLLSQGHHVCDIAVMYPTESMQAYAGSNADTMWKLTDLLSESGLDYDYIDFQSLQNAKIQDKCLSVGKENYKILILADIQALHYETLLKIRDFYRKGGIVIATGSLLKATSRTGEGDAEVKNIWDEIFSGKERGIVEANYQAIPQKICQYITPDFSVSTKKGKVLHRKIGQYDVYMTMNIERGAEVFFRAKGKLERWDAMNGNVKEYPVYQQSENGTRIKYEGDYNTSCLFVFSPGEPVWQHAEPSQFEDVSQVLPVEGTWQTEIIPTMNNKWGDFRLPASDELIGVEAREFSYMFVPGNEKMKTPPIFPEGVSQDIYGYGPYMQTMTLDKSVYLEDFLEQEISSEVWKPYCYSWKYGVFDNPGSQGYHGLKGKVDNRFIILDRGGHQLFETYVYAAQNGKYCIAKEGVMPDYLLIDGKRVQEERIYLKKGWHKLLLAYANTPYEDFVLSEKKSNNVDKRKRSAVVLYYRQLPLWKDNQPYGQDIAMKWYNTDPAPFNIQGGKKGFWVYRFETAPGTRFIHFKDIKGRILYCWIDGKPATLQHHASTNSYTWEASSVLSKVATVIVAAVPDEGFAGTAIFGEPVKIDCGVGEMPVGNWAEFGAMKFYSGGVLYKKSIKVPDSVSFRRVELDLGMVDATCEVKVNGKKMGILMSPPYRMDITDSVLNGENKIEVLVYSTLSNHYQTIPSAYKGKARAGLLGPVKLVFY